MRLFLAALTMAIFSQSVVGAQGNPTTVKEPPTFKLTMERQHLTYENGQIVSSRARGRTTKYEYVNKQISRKTLPNGTTVDYYYDRAGKVQETRFSTGLVRTVHYDRKTGRMSQITGSDGFSMILGGTVKTGLTAIITGPGNYHLDITPKLKATAKAMPGPKKAALTGDMNTPSLMGNDGGSGGCTWNWGVLIPTGSCDFEGGGWGGDWGGGYGDAPDMTFERCMVSLCDPADMNFHRFCNGEPTPLKRYECHAEADRQYWQCEASCR